MTELKNLQNKLKDLPKTMEGNGSKMRALLEAAKILEAYMYSATPVSDGKENYIPKNAAGDSTYERGGALQKSLRRRKSRFKQFGETEVIVGYSKERGKAGWRAHFTEYGYYNAAAKRFIPGQGFMRRAEQVSKTQVEAAFERILQKEFDKLFGQ